MNDEDENFIDYKKKLIVRCTVITVILVIITAVFTSELTLIFNTVLEKKGSSEDAEENIDLISRNLKEFRNLIDECYLGEIDEQKIMDETIKGYINGLDDEYSEYMTKEEWEDFQANAFGNYVGIGIYMSVDKNGNVIILSPIKDTPAEAAGLQSGDVIVSVNDENVLGMDSEKVSTMIKGEEGTKVKLTVFRDPDYVDVEVERKAIKIYHVEHEILDNNIGYVSLGTFDEGCAEEFKTALETLNSKGVNKIIVDLRNNTGGIVEEALTIANMFIEKDKTLLITTDSKGNKEISKAQNDPIIVGKEVVVLVNEYSASASEILVGALKDHGKAKTVGTKTFGKGVIQSVFGLNDGSALKLTINEYFTPNETKINKVGIEPDYVVELNTETEEDEQLNKAIELLNQ